MRSLIKKEGFDFAFDPKACESCGSKCCVGESGDIWASDQEIAAIAAALGEEERVARAIYFRREREGWRIKERETKRGFECVFALESGCKIYDARPAQCRSFPFWHSMNDHLDRLASECAGVYAGAIV
ncbi:MAG: YkgJ family cysteine cluster protein [Helicobacteraceae bacterium]|jgi:Fe-S-cluster containining protein|nr:YkgJ family cysteine cluster protein [Helicobacteraceae bacterium]